MTTDIHEPDGTAVGFTEEESEFLIRSEREIAQILRNAHERSGMVSAYFGGGGDDFALTSILEVSPEDDRFVFGVPSEPERARSLLDSERTMFVTNQDGVRIKFMVEGVAATEFDERPALVSPMPRELLRLQRREFYRVACPLADPVKCTVDYTSGKGIFKAAFVVLDLSLGGLSLMDQHDKLTAEPGMVFKKAVIDLPGVGSFATALEVLNRFEVTLKDGRVTMRAGCKYISPAATAQGMLQKYTMKLEQQRNARFGRR